MNRKWKLLCLVAMLALALGVQPAAAKEEIVYNFEDGTLGPFQAQCDSSSKSYSLELRMDDDVYPQGLPNHYANLKLAPSESRSAVWMGVGYESIGIEMIVRVELDARNSGGCEGCIPLFYVGDHKPIKGSQLTEVADSNARLSDQWTRFKYETRVKAEEMIYVAAGWRAAPGMEGGKAGSVGFDNVTLSIYPAPLRVASSE
jgi:hypothetical protein